MSWQSRPVAVFLIMMPCLSSFSAKFDNLGIISSKTAMALNFHQASHYLTVPID
jgi:hypothetical protein